MEIRKLTPMSRVSSAMAHPSIPPSQCAKFHMPSFFSRSSLLQGPTGSLNRSSVTFWKPASCIYPLARSAMRKVLPSLSPASINVLDHTASTWSSITVPSSDRNSMDISSWSIQPPGRMCLSSPCQSSGRWNRLPSRIIRLPERVAIEPWPVRDRPIQRAHMDQIIVICRMYPGLFHIINLEFEIGWHKAWLDWG